MRVPLLLVLLALTFIPSGLRVLTESDRAIVASGTQVATAMDPTQQQPHAPAEISTSSDVESFFDTFFIQQREQHHIPGAVVALVRDGQLVFAKGYGYADLEARTPVAADETVFRVASVSKPFTAMAIMQLYERGLLELDEDINTYLTGFQLNQTYAEPVTVANLLTHTAGFDEKYVGITAQDGVRPPPPGVLLSRTSPAPRATAGYGVQLFQLRVCSRRPSSCRGFG